MPSDKSDDRCDAKCRDGSACQSYPVSGADRCRMHGGQSPGPGPNNDNAMTHGATASHDTLLKNLDDRDLEWIEDLAIAYRDLAGLEPSDPRCDLIMDAALSSWQRWAARSEAIASDLTSHSTVGVNDDGEPVIRTEEHYLAGMADRLSGEIRRTLKDVGVLGDDDGQVSAQSAAQIIAAAVESSDTGADTSEDEPIDVPNASEDGDGDE